MMMLYIMIIVLHTKKMLCIKMLITVLLVIIATT